MSPFSGERSNVGEDKIQIGISACLLGQQVRYDGGHKRDSYLVDTLGRYVRWVPVCPEAELGMGTPREPVDLVRRDQRTHMIGVRTGEDWTDRMEAFSHRRISRLPALAGYVFKADSPSCGPDRVKLYRKLGGTPTRTGAGLFAAALRSSNPLLPIADERQLQDPGIRENFIERIFAYQRLRALLAGKFSARRLVEFHTAHKFQLVAHSPAAARKLGQLVASPEADRTLYAAGFMRSLEQESTPSRHVNVLQHLMGFFKKQLSAEEKQEALSTIEDYRAGRAPLIVPITLVRHFARRFGVSELARQTYLSPDQAELMLRTHA